MALTLPCLVLAIAVLTTAVIATVARLRIRVNALCAIGVLMCAAGLSLGWGYGRGDVGISSGWPLLTLLGSYIALVTPLGGFIQLITLLADIGVAYDMGMGVVTGAEGLVLAAIGSVVVLSSIVLPIGPNIRPTHKHDTAGRLLTVWKARTDRATGHDEEMKSSEMV